MKLSTAQMVQIAVKVCGSRKLSKQQSSILIGMAENHGAMVTSKQIVTGLRGVGWPRTSSGSVRVSLHRIRKKLAGTGLSMKSSMGPGGGIVLRYDPETGSAKL